MRYFLPFFALITSLLVTNIRAQEITVAFDHSPPYSWLEDGEAHGHLVELMDILLAEQGIRMTAVFCPWARCVNMLEKGEVDFLPGIAYSSNRAEKIAFLQPPIFESSSPFAFFINASRKDIKHQSDLSHLVIGTVRGALDHASLHTNKTITLVENKDVSTLLAMLAEERIDALFYVKETGEKLINETNFKNQFKMASLTLPHNLTGYIGASKNSNISIVKEAMTEALKRLKSSGKLAQILPVQLH